ncbi:FAD:protein FMN transferase [Clostridium sp. OS1-26]|uniref:FAD:protein FMN transferase n=1 Tax=Clostridium sp. OS1-26 TaxID=3070681 RepID=UPI0027E06E50|nr:FAD:protein FMN transferase [Clostridium sp. OS1-26]WML35908.1 FAD:protein FMN transferase [Clostridium sp. OS1-26]
MKKIICVLVACILFTVSFVSCSSFKSQANNQLYEQSNIMMDTVISLKAYGPNAKAAVDEGFKKVDELDKIASPNISTSDVSKINAEAGKEYVKVHPEIIKMIKTSIQYSKLSGGAWDITTGPIINLWGIGTDKQRLPADSEIKAKLPLVGYNNISINETDNSVMLKKQGMAIDLGGIAKGFTADEVLKIFNKYGIKKGLISLGGSSIYAIGTNEEDNLWSVGIKHPRSEDNQNYLGIVKISNQALSTSGDNERYFINNGKRYHHIMNPATGYPADTGVMSDTIIIDSNVEDKNMLADLLTTTIFILGPEKGVQFASNIPGVSCEVTATDNKIYTTKGFKDKITNLNKDFKFAN